MAESDGAAQVFKEIRVDFGDFSAMFNSYSDKLKETEQTWRNISNIWKAMPPIGSSNSATETTSKDNTFRDLSIRNMREQIKYFKSFPEYTKSFNLFRGEMNALTNILGRFGGLGRILGAGSVVGAAAGLAGFAIDRATDYRSRAAQGSAVGVNPYTLQAFNNIFQDYIGEGGAERLFGGLVQQQTTLGGPTFLRNWLSRYGVKTTGRETQQEQVENILEAERKMAQTTDPSRWQKWIETFHIGNVADIGTMMRFRTQGTTAAELKASFAEEEKLRETLRLTAEQDKANKELAKEAAITWQRVGKNLDTITAALAPVITDFLKKFGVLSETPGGVEKNIVKGTIKDFIIPFVKMNEEIDKWWNNFKSKIPGFSGLFGISPAKAGELPPSAPIPVQDKALLDYLLKQAGSISTDSLIDGGGTGVPIGIRRRGSGRSFGVNTLWGGDKGTGGLTFAASLNMSPEDRALLDVLALRESGSKSYLSGDPDFGAAFQGNRYQFLGATWAHNAKEIGANVNDLSPENQDRIALHLAKKLIGNRWDEAVRNPSILRSILGPTWHGVWNEDTGVTFQKALEGERLRKKLSDESKPVPKARFHITDPNPDPLTSHQYPAKGEKTSMNDLSNFQGAWPRNHIALKVYNQAGGNFLVQSAMLGSGSGSFRPS